MKKCGQIRDTDDKIVLCAGRLYRLRSSWVSGKAGRHCVLEGIIKSSNLEGLSLLYP